MVARRKNVPRERQFTSLEGHLFRSAGSVFFFASAKTTHAAAAELRWLWGGQLEDMDTQRRTETEW